MLFELGVVSILSFMFRIFFLVFPVSCYFHFFDSINVLHDFRLDLILLFKWILKLPNKKFKFRMLNIKCSNPGFVQDNKDLYAEEAAAQREMERQRMLSIPGLISPNEIQDEMVDS